MPVGVFNSAAPLEAQLTDFSCSVGATFWCLRSVGVDITQAALQEIMVPTLVSPDLGLLDASGATIAALLHDRFGLPASSLASVSFDDIAARAGKQPVALGGRRWHVDANGNATGHWVAVRRLEGDRLVLANPGGTGPNFGQSSLGRDDFAARGGFSAVLIDAASGPRFRIANTDGQGANMRADPSTSGALVKSLAEGADVAGEDHAWRRVTLADGTSGWVAEEFLVAEH